MEKTRTDPEVKQHNMKNNSSMHPHPDFYTIGSTSNQTREKVDFPNRRHRSPYHNIALSRLKLKNFRSSTNALSRPIQEGFSLFLLFKNSKHGM